jgi:GNAT superfamily N-acetyltransferase
MQDRHMLRVEPLPPAAADDTAAMCVLSDLVNKVYAESEAGLWLDGAARTSPEELAGITRAGQLVVARLAGRLVGCVRVQRHDDSLSEFGMLAAAPEHHGTGIGRELVRYAERHSLAEGRPVMRLELLVPRGWRHPSKERLAEWYGRLGYRLVRVGTLDEDYPHLAPLLTAPCEYRIYHKDL